MRVKRKVHTTFFQGQTSDNELFYYIAMKMMMSAIINYVRKREKNGVKVKVVV